MLVIYQGKHEVFPSGVVADMTLASKNPLEKNNFLLWLVQNYKELNEYSNVSLNDNILNELEQILVGLDEYRLVYLVDLEFYDLKSVDAENCEFSLENNYQYLIRVGVNFKSSYYGKGFKASKCTKHNWQSIWRRKRKQSS